MVSQCQWCGRLFGHRDDEPRVGCNMSHESELRHGRKPTVEDLQEIVRSMNEFLLRQSAELRRVRTKEYILSEAKKYNE